MIGEAFENVKRTNERCCEPEVYRVAAEVITRKPPGNAEAAEQHLRHAIEIARNQSAKWWELRATMSLARLLRDTGRRDEARAMLAEIYGWFTEGFDTADLKDLRPCWTNYPDSRRSWGSMRCSKCGTDNREGRKFCAQCGAPMKPVCPSCGAENEPGEKFCGECGTAFAAKAVRAATSSAQAASVAPNIRVSPEQPDASTLIEGERKTVTGLFADIKVRSC